MAFGAAAVAGCSSDGGANGATPGGADAGTLDGGQVDGAPGDGQDGQASDAGPDAHANMPDASDTDAGACVDPPPVPGPLPGTPPLCNPAGTWDEGKLLDLPASERDQLRAITPDELTIVWSANFSQFSTLKLADRASGADPFGAPTDIVGLVASSGVGLSPDGLRACGKAAGFIGFVEATRASRGQALGEPTEGAFSVLNAEAAAKTATLEDCVISPDDKTLYYSNYDPNQPTHSVHVSTRASTSDPWPVGKPVPWCVLARVDTAYRHPTGASADGRTLFYRDETTLTARQATGPGLAWPFSTIVDLGGKGGVTVNQSCNHLYFSGTVGDDQGIFVATAK